MANKNIYITGRYGEQFQVLGLLVNECKPGVEAYLCQSTKRKARYQVYYYFTEANTRKFDVPDLQKRPEIKPEKIKGAGIVIDPVTQRHGGGKTE